jgi:hypothetical protein
VTVILKRFLDLPLALPFTLVSKQMFGSDSTPGSQSYSWNVSQRREQGGQTFNAVLDLNILTDFGITAGYNDDVVPSVASRKPVIQANEEVSNINDSPDSRRCNSPFSAPCSLTEEMLCTPNMSEHESK